MSNAPSFNEVSRKIINDILKQNKLHYLASKKSFVADAEAEQSAFYFITTPHPIGNLSTVQCMMLDTISRLDALKIRAKYESEKYTTQKKDGVIKGYLNLLKYDATELKDIESHLKKHTESTAERRQLEEYQKRSLATNKLVDLFLASANLDIDAIQKKILEFTLSLGLPSEVITKPIQTLQQSRKSKQLAILGIAEKTWGNVDADGDKENPLGDLIQGIQDKGLLEIYGLASSNREDLSKTYEPRISCDDKKGVVGIMSRVGLTEAQGIAGLEDISSLSDLMDDKKFNEAYSKFVQELEQETYPDRLDATNGNLDFIMRVSSPAFINAEGLVLSDFDSQHGPAIVSRLLFIVKATEKFLSERGGQAIKISQTILPLCENKEAIEGASKSFSSFLGQVKRLYNEISSKPIVEQEGELKKLKALLVSENGKFIYGGFYGPSDLTKDLGGQSITVIKEAMQSARKIWEEFIKTVPNLGLQEVSFLQEYGKGTSPRRGEFMIHREGTTRQGTNIRTLSSNNAKTTARLSDFQLAEDVEVSFSGEFIQGAIKAHREFLYEGDAVTHGHGAGHIENKGSIIKEFDRLNAFDVDNSENAPLFRILKKSFANNQGTRGKNQVPLYINQRAIGAATTINYIGLLSAPAFPLDISGEKKYGFDLKTVLTSQEGLGVIIHELFQFAAMDGNRALSLGFNKIVIDKSYEYAKKTLEFLASELDVTLQSNSSLREHVEQIVDSFLALDYVKSDFHHLQKPLEQFKHQLDSIEMRRDAISSLVEQAKQELGVSEQESEERAEEGRARVSDVSEVVISDKTNANLAFAVNSLANFQLPLIPGKKMKQEKLAGKEQTYWCKEAEAEAAVQRESQARGA